MSDKRRVIRIDPPPGEKYDRFTMMDITLPTDEECRKIREERERAVREGKVPPVVWGWKPKKDVDPGTR